MFFSYVCPVLCAFMKIKQFFSRDDTRAEAEQLARKLTSLRLWEDGAGRRWASSASDLGLEILCVSQFTLYHTMKGNKPDFRQAMGGTESSLLYQVPVVFV